MDTLNNGVNQKNTAKQEAETTTLPALGGNVDAFLRDSFGESYSDHIDDSRLSQQLQAMHLEEISQLDVPAGESDVFTVAHGNDAVFKQMVADWLDKPEHAAHRDNLRDYIGRIQPGLAQEIEKRGTRSIGEVLADNLEDNVIVKVHEPRKGAGFDPDYGSRIHQRQQLDGEDEIKPEARDLPLLFVQQMSSDGYLIIQPETTPVDGHPPGVEANEGAELSQWGALQDEETERLTYYLFDYNVIDANLRSLNTTAEQEAENFDNGVDQEDDADQDPDLAIEAASIDEYVSILKDQGDLEKVDELSVGTLSDAGGQLDVEEFRQNLATLPVLAPEISRAEFRASIETHLEAVRQMGIEVPGAIEQALNEFEACTGDFEPWA